MADYPDDITRAAYEVCYSTEPEAEVILEMPKASPPLEILTEVVEEYERRSRELGYRQIEKKKSFSPSKNWLPVYRIVVAVLLIGIFHFYTLPSLKETQPIIFFRLIFVLFVHCVFFAVCIKIDRQLKKWRSEYQVMEYSDHLV